MILRFCAALAVGLVVISAQLESPPLHLLTSQQIAPDFRLEKIATNVYAFISNNTTHSWEDGNTTVIITDKGVIVVDAPSTYLSEMHLAEIRKLTNKPVVYVINTHWHKDHVFGNHVYKDAFPDVKIIARDFTKQKSDSTNPARLQEYFRGASGAAIVEELRKEAEQGIDENGKTLTGCDLIHAKRDYQEYLLRYQAAQRTAYVGPNETFSEKMTLRLGSTVLELMHFESHTAGDAVVYLPKENILITGDLVMTPNMYAGPTMMIGKWLNSLEALLAIHAAIVVPGHGEVEFGNDDMQLEHDMLRSLMDQANRAVAEHRTLDQFKAALDLSAYKAKMIGDDREKQWGWDNYFINQAAERAFAIASGAP